MRYATQLAELLATDTINAEDLKAGDILVRKDSVSQVTSVRKNGFYVEEFLKNTYSTCYTYNYRLTIIRRTTLKET